MNIFGRRNKCKSNTKLPHPVNNKQRLNYYYDVVETEVKTFLPSCVFVCVHQSTEMEAVGQSLTMQQSAGATYFGGHISCVKFH